MCRGGRGNGIAGHFGGRVKVGPTWVLIMR
jgi:hypothetical protein